MKTFGSTTQQMPGLYTKGLNSDRLCLCAAPRRPALTYHVATQKLRVIASAVALTPEQQRAEEYNNRMKE